LESSGWLRGTSTARTKDTHTSVRPGTDRGESEEGVREEIAEEVVTTIDQALILVR